MTTRWAWRLLGRALYAGMIAAVVLCSPQPLKAADAGSVDLCVTMSGGNSQVGGLQMDLTWDAGCMTAQRAEGNAVQCASNPATAKNVQTALRAANVMRALFLSVSNKRPIPDGQLFCCSFTPASAQANPCCSVNIGNLILSPPTGGSRLYVSDLPDISVEVQVSGISCAASVPGGSSDNPVRPSAPAAAAIVQPPAVSAPVAPPAGGPAPLLPRPNIPAQAAPVQGGAAGAQTPELAPTEPAPSPGVTPAAMTRTVARTAAPTPARPTATAPKGTPQAQGTPTGPAVSATAAPTTATQPAATPTAVQKHKGHKKRRHAAPN